jgi:hypothetical protein
MRKTQKMVLSRETLRHLGDRGGTPDGPYGTEPASIGQTMCCTASCHGPHTC